MYYVIEASQVQKQGGIPTTSNNYPLDKNGYAIPILFDAINFGSNKAIPADSPTASPEDVMNNVLSAFCSNSSDITISQQEYTNNTDSPEKAMSVPALPPVSCAPTQQVAVSIPQNQPAPTETAVSVGGGEGELPQSGKRSHPGVQATKGSGCSPNRRTERTGVCEDEAAGPLIGSIPRGKDRCGHPPLR